MSASTTIKRLGLEKAFQYLYKDPEKNLPKPPAPLVSIFIFGDIQTMDPLSVIIFSLALS
jgi:hypothetical protein